MENNNLIDYALLANLFKLKTVKRVITSEDGTLENDAEHTAFTVLLAVVFDSQIPKAVNRALLYQLIAIHDTCEIFYKDTYFLDNKENKRANESRAIKQLYKKHPALRELWNTYEYQGTIEALYARAFDKLQPMIAQVLNNGTDWKIKKVTRELYTSHINEFFAEFGSYQPLRPLFNEILEVANDRGLFYAE